ncbi:putative two pore channel 1, partial [Operophtera brumata]
MATLRSPSPPSDGYKRFSDDFANTSINNYGSNVTNTRTESDGAAGGDGTLDMGSRSSLHTGLHMSEDEHWEMNYHEAAIYLEEGLNNEKFDSHPSSPEELPAYLRVHNPWYHGLDLLASLVLILLAFTEDPALPVWAHGTVELLALAVIGVELHLKLKWIGWSTILKHKRTMIKGITLLIMVLEAVVVLCRQSSHFRVTRALRPIFLVDTRHCGGVRRFIRQILQSLPPIIDMLGLLMFFVATYSLLGYYLFSEHIDNGHFKTISDSFVSMFVLLTTANFPDVMMPSYAKSKWYVLFFILYIITVLYVLMNLMLAVVYETFTRIEREKCRALLLHRRLAARHAFRLLVSRRAPHAVKLRHFAGLMRHYAPHYTGLDVYLMFKQLNTDTSTGGVTRTEFANLYEVFALRWVPQAARAPWYARLMRLYKLKKRYRDVFGTLVLLSPLMSSAGCVMLNLITSGVTLFELTVVNNWFILMNAYASVAGQFTRIYFMVSEPDHERCHAVRADGGQQLVFYLFTMVVLTIVVASVLEAFRFRIQYKRSTTKRDEEKLLHEEVHTSWEEAQGMGASGDLAEELRPHLPPGVEVTFVGSRPRTKE